MIMIFKKKLHRFLYYRFTSHPYIVIIQLYYLFLKKKIASEEEI